MKMSTLEQHNNNSGGAKAPAIIKDNDTEINDFTRSSNENEIDIGSLSSQSTSKKFVHWQNCDDLSLSADIESPLGEPKKEHSPVKKRKYKGNSEQQEQQLQRQGDTTSRDSNDVSSKIENIEKQMKRMEQKIKYAAKVELSFLNKSKKLREYRRTLTQRYEELASSVSELVQVDAPDAAQPQVHRAMLPPLPSDPKFNAFGNKRIRYSRPGMNCGDNF